MEHPNKRQVPVTLGIIEPVTDDEQVGNWESHIIRADGLASTRGFFQENTNTEASRASSAQAGRDAAEGLAGIEDIVDHEDIPVAEVEAEFLGKHQFAGFAAGAIAGDAEEIQFNRERDVP